MHSFARNVLVAAGAVSAAAFLVLACGTDNESEFVDGDASTPGVFDPDGAFGDGGVKSDADLYANDPPPRWCGPDTQPPPPQPGGTEECPADKNKPGCACPTAGEQAPCWTGLRANRNLGICKDGVATCVAVNETRREWSACEGQVLPVQGAAKGKDACKCFSQGQWKIANLSPCLVYYGQTPNASNMYAVSTVPDPAGARCPDLPQNAQPPPQPGSAIWSTDTLKVDCAGKFKLCYELKAGNFDSPQPTDCSLAKVCVEGVYEKEDVEQAFPDLPSWTTDASKSACAYQWETQGGYGEMTVVGESVRCDAIDDGAGNAFVFNRVRYCPSTCRDPANANLPECQNCQQGGSGVF